jgi:hypothetical protein
VILQIWGPLGTKESTWENPDPKRRISPKTTVKYPRDSKFCDLRARCMVSSLFKVSRFLVAEDIKGTDPAQILSLKS